MTDKPIVDEKTLYSVVEKAKKYDEIIKPFGTKELHCSFCGKPQSQLKKLIAGPGHTYICNECIELCHEILIDEGVAKRNKWVKPDEDDPIMQGRG